MANTNNAEVSQYHWYQYNSTTSLVSRVSQCVDSGYEGMYTLLCYEVWVSMCMVDLGVYSVHDYMKILQYYYKNMTDGNGMNEMDINVWYVFQEGKDGELGFLGTHLWKRHKIRKNVEKAALYIHAEMIKYVDQR